MAVAGRCRRSCRVDADVTDVTVDTVGRVIDASADDAELGHRAGAPGSPVCGSDHVLATMRSKPNQMRGSRCRRSTGAAAAPHRPSAARCRRQWMPATPVSMATRASVTRVAPGPMMCQRQPRDGRQVGKGGHHARGIVAGSPTMSAGIGRLLASCGRYTGKPREKSTPVG